MRGTEGRTGSGPLVDDKGVLPGSNSGAGRQTPVSHPIAVAQADHEDRPGTRLAVHERRRQTGRSAPGTGDSRCRQPCGKVESRIAVVVAPTSTSAAIWLKYGPVVGHES